MKQNCMECSAPLKGRSDKKFCDDSCRNAYNNRQNRITNNKVRNINRILNKNYKILSELSLAGQYCVSKDMLTGKGFDFNYFTGISENEKGDQCYMIYDEAFYRLNDWQVVLVEKEELLRAAI